MSFGDKLKGLFGGAPKPAKTPAKSKTYIAPSNRAALIAECMDVHRRARAKAQGVLEQALKELVANPPKPSDREGVIRLLTLRQAVLRMKATATNAKVRTQVVAGVKGLRDDTSSAKGMPRSKKH